MVFLAVGRLDFLALAFGVFGKSFFAVLALVGGRIVGVAVLRAVHAHAIVSLDAIRRRVVERLRSRRVVAFVALVERVGVFAIGDLHTTDHLEGLYVG